jgi:predicted AAA+ superfamily ATPase
MTSAYQLKPWTQVVTPHQDILDGKLDSSIYAASLGQVVRQDPQCSDIYLKADRFFNATYLTKELRNLLEIVLKGLCGEAGDRVLQLRTPFGGGKTHSLIALYHITKNRAQLVHIPELATLPNPQQVNIAAFFGTDRGITEGIEVADGSTVLTPWGYIAWELGGASAFAAIAEQDRLRICPGNDLLRKILGDRANLILLDEFLLYVENAMALTVGDSTFGKQVLIFTQRLTEVVKDLPNTVLVYSLQASVQEALGEEGLLNTLDKLVSRIDAKKEPVAGDEVMKVVQRRLFANIGTPEVIAEIARHQAELFRRFRESYEETERGKQEVRQQAEILADRIQFSYPFHPDLLDLMYYRWGSLPSYQRTRGALQFLARAIHALWHSKDSSLLISPSDIPLHDTDTRQAFFTQIGQRDAYDAVISADLTGRKAKVKAIDQRLAQDAPAIAHMQVGTRLATAIMLYSFGAKVGEDSGVLEQDIISACLRSGLDRTTISATLSDLRDQLLYLHYANKHYRFETKPNLNKLIADEESKITSDDVLEKIRAELTKSLQVARGKVNIWAKEPSAISDRQNQFTIAYLSPEWAEKNSESALTEAMIWLEDRKREYKNALAFVIPNKPQLDKSRRGARIALAIASLITQKAKYKFSVEDLEELNIKAKDATSELTAAIRRLYEYMLLPLPCTDAINPIRLEKIDLQSQLNTSQNLQDRVLDALKSHIFESIQPNKLIQLSGLETSTTGYIKGEDLVNFFFKAPTFPKMLDVKGIQQAVLKAIEQGRMGYVPYMTIASDGVPKVDNPSLISFQKSIPLDELDLGGYLLSSRLASELLTPPKAEPVAGETSTDISGDRYDPDEHQSDRNLPTVGDDPKRNNYKTIISATSSIEKRVSLEIVEGKRTAHAYTLKASTDKAKVFHLFEILQALSDRSDTMNINIEVKVTSTKGFDRSWINGAIEEPLDEADIKATTRLE